MKQHINYLHALDLFLRRFGPEAEAFDNERGVWLEADALRELYNRGVSMAAVSEHWKGGGYITEAHTCYFKWGKQYAIAVTLECSVKYLLPTLTMYWAVKDPFEP